MRNLFTSPLAAASPSDEFQSAIFLEIFGTYLSVFTVDRNVARCISYSSDYSVCLSVSVTRRYCVKTSERMMIPSSLAVRSTM